VDKKYLKKIKNKKDVNKTDFFIVDDLYISKTSSKIISGFSYKMTLPKNITNIKLVEIIPQYNGHNYKVNIVYDYVNETIVKKLNEIESIKSQIPNKKLTASEYKQLIDDEIKRRQEKCNKISIDLGIVNLMTIYNPIGDQIIIPGGYLVSLNKYFNKILDKMKSNLAVSNKELTSKKYRNLLQKRHNIINNYFNILVKWLLTKYIDVEIFIVGYNTNWKNKTNMGSTTNRKFYDIPFKQLLDKLRFQLEQQGKVYIEVNESYTSKCDALALESLTNLEYKGKRIKRGLYKSSTGKLINADINGAINIMRKYYINQGWEFKLSSINVQNPKKTMLRDLQKLELNGKTMLPVDVLSK
jgi:IS605 OrfB family transposase